jgi:hypothetical protein
VSPGIGGFAADEAAEEIDQDRRVGVDPLQQALF